MLDYNKNFKEAYLKNNDLYLTACSQRALAKIQELMFYGKEVTELEDCLFRCNFQKIQTKNQVYFALDSIQIKIIDKANVIINWGAPENIIFQSSPIISSFDDINDSNVKYYRVITKFINTNNILMYNRNYTMNMLRYVLVTLQERLLNGQDWIDIGEYLINEGFKRREHRLFAAKNEEPDEIEYVFENISIEIGNDIEVDVRIDNKLQLTICYVHLDNSEDVPRMLITRFEDCFCINDLLKINYDKAQ